jgi:hypothetical protein
MSAIRASKRKLAFCNVGIRETSERYWEQIYVDQGKEPISSGDTTPP